MFIKTYLANSEYLRSPNGPVSKLAKATCAKFIEGVDIRLHNSCEQFTNMCIQCVHITPIKSVPKSPTYRPAFLNAAGIARIPVPMFPLSKWISVSIFEVGCSRFLCCAGSYSSIVLNFSSHELAERKTNFYLHYYLFVIGSSPREKLENYKRRMNASRIYNTVFT